MTTQLGVLEKMYRENENELHKLAEVNKDLASAIEKLKRISYIAPMPPPEEKNKEKKTIRETVLESIDTDETVTVGQVWDRVKEKGIATTKATVNTAMADLAKKRILDKPAIGSYKKV